MNHTRLCIILMGLMLWLPAVGQHQLVLKHIQGKKKDRYIGVEFLHSIQTVDTTYKYKRIEAFTDSTISITISVDTGRDTTYYQPYRTRQVDTVYVHTYSVFRTDTVVLPFFQILQIKKYWFKDRGWMEGFAWLSTATVLMIPALPVAVISDGSVGLRDWAMFEAILIGICGPPLFIGSRMTTYDLTEEWILTTEK